MEKQETLDKAIVLGTDSANNEMLLRVNDEGISIVKVCPVVEGRSLHGEVVELRSEAPGLYAVRSLYKEGPAQVSSDTYRANYDRIFSSKNTSIKN